MIDKPLAIYVVAPADVHYVKAFAAHLKCVAVDGSWPGVKGERGVRIYGIGQARVRLLTAIYLCLDGLPDRIRAAQVPDDWLRE